jgi:hypothetical protein
MKTFQRKHISAVAMFIILLLPVLSGCDPFQQDGITSPDEIAKKGYFYIADRGTNSLIMLDYGMHELKTWSLSAIAPDTVALQGITFNGKNVWISFSGNEKFIAKLDATDNNLAIVSSIKVPPYVNSATQGTVRGIANDGQYLWAVNSGSATYALSPTLYKISLTNDSTVASYQMPVTAPRGITSASIAADAYGKGPAAGLYFLDNDTKYVYYFNNSIPSFTKSFAAPVPPAGTTWDQTLGITNDGESFYTLSYSDLASYLFKTSYLGEVGFSYKLPYKYPVAVVWSDYDIRTIIPPTVTGISPASGAQGKSVSTYISGTGFKSGTGLSVSLGSGVTVDTLTYVSSTSLYAHLTIDASATLGKRSIVVTNPNGSTATGDSLFNVTAVPVTEYLFLTDDNDKMLRQIRISDNTVVQSSVTTGIASGTPRGLAYDGTNLYMGCSSPTYKIYKITLSNGVLTASDSIACPFSAGTLQGLTYYNGALWVLQTNTAGMIYKLDPSTGAVLDSIVAPATNYARGLCFANGLLYCNDSNGKNVYSCDPTVKLWTVAFAEIAPSSGTTSTTGMFFTGTNFWMANSGGTSAASDILIEASTSGSSIRTLSAPNAGAAKPWGIVYCQLKDN